jgi:peptidoglycan hydrolase-like protein with peptidoglycan-binding domain
MHDLQQRPNTPPSRSSRGAPGSSARSQGSSGRSMSSARSASTRGGAPRRPRRPTGSGAGGFDRRPLFIVAIAATVLCAFFALASSGKSSLETVAMTPTADAAADVAVDATTAATTAIAPAVDAAATGAAAAQQPVIDQGTASTIAGAVQDLDGSDLTSKDSCLMTEQSVRLGASGPSVVCVQQALTDAGFYKGSMSGQFDQATHDAAKAMQADRDLFVDGIIGRESALSLGVWPDEASLVVHTPKPPAGAKDLMGYPLSSVASAGADAPPLPPNSGSGRRLVYDRAGQRVWAVADDGSIIRSWLVSGSKYSNEIPGTHEVYSRSDVSTAWNGKAYLPHMVRWLKTDIGAIGFHAIPLHVADGTAYMTEDELGTRLSGGCQRQAVKDANFTWDFAQIGTKVVVI